MASMHLIRFPNKGEHKRAIMALLEVPRLESLGLPGFKMVVTDEHIQALERAKITFTYLSKTALNGGRPTIISSPSSGNWPRP
jgi:hypothetical protein